MVDAAQRLAQVRKACLTFLDRWAVARLLSDSPGIDRVMGDVHAAWRRNCRSCKPGLVDLIPRQRFGRLRLWRRSFQRRSDQRINTGAIIDG